MLPVAPPEAGDRVFSQAVLPLACAQAESMLELAQHFELKPLVRQCTESIAPWLCELLFPCLSHEHVGIIRDVQQGHRL